MAVTERISATLALGKVTPLRPVGTITVPDYYSHHNFIGDFVSSNPQLVGLENFSEANFRLGRTIDPGDEFEVGAVLLTQHKDVTTSDRIAIARAHRSAYLGAHGLIMVYEQLMRKPDWFGRSLGPCFSLLDPSVDMHALGRITQIPFFKQNHSGQFEFGSEPIDRKWGHDEAFFVFREK